MIRLPWCRRACMVILCLGAALPATTCAGRRGAQLGARAVVIPTRYDEHRFYITPVTTSGDTLAFILDSGLNSDFFSVNLAARLGLPREPLVKRGDTLWLTGLPPLAATAAIPAPDTAGPLGGRFVLLPLEGQGLLIARPGDAGALGSPWLAGRVWTFDYPGHRLLWYPQGATPPRVPAAHQVRLGFALDAQGRRTTSFPRLPVIVDGDTLDMLFDTGATLNVAEAASAMLADGRPARQGGSFVVLSRLERWHQRHPDWRILERAEALSGFPAIEVPVVEVGGYRVGPVWFTAREDADFHRTMDRLMDRPIVGSFGGSALRFFAVTVDYPQGIAGFVRPGGI